MLRSFTSLNNPSTESLSDAFNDIIQSKFNQDRCLDPLSKEELEREIEPFQSSLQLHLGARRNIWGQHDQELHIRRQSLAHRTRSRMQGPRRGRNVHKLDGFDPAIHVKTSDVEYGVRDRGDLGETVVLIPWAKVAKEKVALEIGTISKSTIPYPIVTCLLTNTKTDYAQ